MNKRAENALKILRWLNDYQGFFEISATATTAVVDAAGGPYEGPRLVDALQAAAEHSRSWGEPLN
jgi:hypothetical protein